MLIHVMYDTDTYDFVPPSLLDVFLAQGRISMFRRKSGWVFVGIDPVRTAPESFRLHDRRRKREER